jgi:hypothetical protein
VTSLVQIVENAALSDCSALERLLDFIDDAAPGPGPNGQGIPDVGGSVSIDANLPGCNSVEEIVGAVFTSGFE